MNLEAIYLICSSNKRYGKEITEKWYYIIVNPK